MMHDILRLDLSNLKCPLPVLRTRKALLGLAEGAWLEVRCTDPLASIDIPNLLRESGDSLENSQRLGEQQIFLIRKASKGQFP